MEKSIISNEHECYLCKSTLNLHKHHFIPGKGYRALSEKYGLYAYLCAKHHNYVHSGAGTEYMKELRKIAQTKAMAHYGWTTEEWIKIFDFNNLWEDEP